MALVWAVETLSVLVVMVRAVFYPFIVLIAVVLQACATHSIQQPVVSPAQLSSSPDLVAKGNELLWGGEIVSVVNESDSTLLEILAYPLKTSGEPATGYTSIGRFLADREGFLEPHEYPAGSRVTVKGPLLGFKDGKVDEAIYRYPALDAVELTLWPAEIMNQYHQPRVNVGFGIGSHGRSGVGIGVGF